MPLAGRDPHVRDLTAWEADPVTVGYGDDVAGRGPLGNRIARVISRALRDAKDGDLSRAEIVQRMSESLGRSISAAQLDKWASEAAEEHRIPLDAFVALIEASGRHELLGFVPAGFGYAVVPARYVDMIELVQLEEHERELKARKSVLEAKLRGRRP